MAMSHHEVDASFFGGFDLSMRVILILIIILAILGNILVLVATWKERSLHQPNKYFVACLAVADLLVGMILFPLRLYQLVNAKDGGIASVHLCRFYIWLDVFMGTASIYKLTFASFDQYLKIIKPLRYKTRMTSFNSLKGIFITWLIAATNATSALFPYGDSPGIVISSNGCLNINQIFYTFAVVSTFFVPTIFMLVINAHIFLVARERETMPQNGEVGQMSNNTNKQIRALLPDLKLIYMLFVVAGAFILCWVINYYKPSLLFITSWSLSDVYLITVLHRAVDIVTITGLRQKYKNALKQLFLQL